MERRQFLKKSCRACVIGLTSLTVPSFFKKALAETRNVGARPKHFSTAVTAQNEILIPAAEFTENPWLIVNVKDWEYEMSVHQSSTSDATPSTYLALLLRCTHMDNNLDVFGSAFSCSLHGSRFDMEGMVRKGPASDPLLAYATEIRGNQVVVTSKEIQR